MEKIIFDLGKSPKLTVALPVYNSKKIAWISLESLIKQININFDWELIIYEEQHSESIITDIIYDYIEGLKKVNCVKILFLTSLDKPLLIDKWIEIGKNTSPSSEVFVLHAADCHSPKTRLSKTFDKIYNENYDWYDQTKGYFYSFISDKIILYDFNGLTNLNMGLKTKYIKTLPKSDLKRGIDGYIYKHCQKIINNSEQTMKHYYDNQLYMDSVDTHGYNNISVDREKYFESKPNIFKIQSLKLTQMDLSEDNLKKLESLKYENNQTTVTNCDLSIIISTYENVEYLKDCFTSIQNSIGDKNVEVLVGIDGCLKSKEFITNNKFNKNFKFYFFEENNGPYIVFNTLSKLVTSDNLLFFGSDDIMNLNMVEDSIDGLKTHDCVKPYYTNFIDGKPFDSETKKHVGEGVFAIKKDIFNYMNGFEPWMCAADSDFMARIYSLKKYKFKFTNRINFYRRIHKNGLTSRPDTGMKSKLRAHYGNLARKRNTIGPLFKMVTKPYIKVQTEILESPINEITPTKSIVVENISPLSLILNRNTNPQPIRNSTSQEIKQTPKPQIKERPPIDNGIKNKTIEEKQRNSNSLSNKAKDYIVDKKIHELKIKPKVFPIGKDSLRI